MAPPAETQEDMTSHLAHPEPKQGRDGYSCRWPAYSVTTKATCKKGMELSSSLPVWSCRSALTKQPG